MHCFIQLGTKLYWFDYSKIFIWCFVRFFLHIHFLLNHNLKYSISGSSATVYTYLGEFHNNKYRARSILGGVFIFCVFVILLPVLAWIIINQNWNFHIPIIDIQYKPWRLFILLCGLPSFFCGFALIKVPESPKFMLSQGNSEEVIQILKQMYSLNTRKNREELKLTLIPDETIEVPKGKISLIWSQTAPLFKAPHLKTTIIACILQFWIFFTAEGLFLWFPDIVNRVSSYTSDDTITICEIIQIKEAVNSTEIVECIEILDTLSYEVTIYMQILYCVGSIFLCWIVNFSKCRVICSNLLISGVFAILVVYVNMPHYAIYFLVIAILCGLAPPVINAATIDLYPTKLRAMGLCITSSTGRVGSVIGANFVATFLDRNCSSTFWISGMSLIGEWVNFSNHFLLYIFLFI